MELVLNQHEQRFEKILQKVYENAIEKYPELDRIDISVNTGSSSENLKVCIGTEEDKGKYLLILVLISNASVLKFFAMGLATILFIEKYGESEEIQQDKRFIEIFENLYKEELL